MPSRRATSGIRSRPSLITSSVRRSKLRKVREELLDDDARGIFETNVELGSGVNRFHGRVESEQHGRRLLTSDSDFVRERRAVRHRLSSSTDGRKARWTCEERLRIDLAP